MNNAEHHRLRDRVLKRAERWLRWEGSPRLCMSAILLISGMVGFLGSSLMLMAGLETMALRYPLAMGFAYGCYLFLLWLWLWYAMRNGPAQLDGMDLYHGVDAVTQGSLCVGSGSELGAGDAVGFLDLDGALVILLVSLLLLSVVVCAYVIWIAPALMAEMLVDGFMLTGVYGRIKRQDESHWLHGVLRRTWLPALALALFLAAVGGVIQWYLPEAHSLGAVVEYLLSE